MNVVIDAGNSSIRFAWFRDRELVNLVSLPLEGGIQWPIPDELGKATHVLLSSVVDVPEAWRNSLKKSANLIELTTSTPLPIINRYRSPQTLGSDRIANACGAAALFPSRDVLVVDAGTCLKFDVVTAQGEYPGGSISPGLRMRFEALHHSTGRLPLLRPAESAPLTGYDTETSMQSGILNGMCAEIEGIIADYGQNYPGIKVLLTGGDGPFFLNHLKTSIFAAHSITLQGLNAILLHNVDINS